MAKEIWVPKTETRATVRDGQVIPWEEIRFESRPVNAQATGFSGATRDDMRRDTMRPTTPPPSEMHRDGAP